MGGIPGLVDDDRRASLRAQPAAGTGLDFAVALGARLGRGADRVDNDATCATVAEWELGAGRGGTDAVMVTLGTGIGGGLMADGLVVRGANGFAGEIGHMVVDPTGRCARAASGGAGSASPRGAASGAWPGRRRRPAA